MSISTYADLQTSVASWLHRDDLTALIPDFITLAEAKLNRRLRLRAQETKTTGTVSASVALPSGFAQVIALTVTSGSDTYPVLYKTASEITGDNSNTYYYTIIGDNIVFDPVESGYTYELTYYAKFDALSSSVNWLLTNAPDVYLYATLMESAPYLKNDPRIQVWSGLLENAIKDLETQNNNAKYGNSLCVRAA